MSKRKRREEPPVDEAAAAEEQPQPAAASEPELEKPYTTGTWKGLTQYRCRFCQWDTVRGERAMLEHYAARHAPKPPPPKPVLVPVYDRFGNLVPPKREE